MDLQWAISKLTIKKITNAFRKINFIIFTCILILISEENHGLSLLVHQLPTTTFYNTQQVPREHLVPTCFFVCKCTQHLSSHLNKTHQATTIHNKPPPTCSLSHSKSLSSISLLKRNEDNKFSFTNKHSQKIYRTMGIRQVL